MSSTQFWVGMLVPPFIKRANPYLKKFFKLNEFDAQTNERVTTKQYPIYYGVLYGLWVITILGSGVVVLLFMMIYGKSFFPEKSFFIHAMLGLINMIGVWFIAGALLDFLLWKISSANFRDYIIMRQIKSGWGYEMDQQIAVLFKLGFIYYLITTPIMLYLII